MIRDITIHQKGGAHWVEVLAKPRVRDSVLVKDADGKIQYVKIMYFGSRSWRDVFSAAVKHAPNFFEDCHQGLPKRGEA